MVSLQAGRHSNCLEENPMADRLSPGNDRDVKCPRTTLSLTQGKASEHAGRGLAMTVQGVEAAG